MSSHKSHIRNDTGCKVLSAHFSQIHSLEDMSVTPIEILDKKLSLKEREEREEAWMKKLNTIYPYGLNVRAKTCGIMDSFNEVESSKTVVYSTFDKVVITRYGRGGRQQTTDDSFDAEQFITDLVRDDLLRLRIIRTKITQLNYDRTKLVYLSAVRRLSVNVSTHLRQILHVIKDIALYRCKKVWSKKSRPKSNNFMVVQYTNKYVEDINLNKILKDPEIMRCCPLGGTAASPTVSFKYPATIRSKIVNYRQTHEANLDHRQLVCDCVSSQFKDHHHQHVVTGNLDIIQNSDLRILLKKGLNYRDQAAPDKQKALEAVRKALDSYIKKKSSKTCRPEVMFSEWKASIVEAVENRLENLGLYDFNCILSKPSVKDEIIRLQEKYVFVPTDKANKNVSLICKKFYVQLLQDEINSDTYQLSTETEEEIILRHADFLKSHGIKIKSENRKLPYLYGTTKMHKDPIKFRFITSGRNSSLQQLSVAVGLCLKACLKVAKNYSKYSNKFHRRNDFYVIDNNSDVLDFMFENNFISGNKSISTFDFSTLFTSIPHNQLKDNLTKFVNRIFDIKNKNFVVCNEYLKNAYFSDRNSVNSSYLKFSKFELLECIYFLIDNAYVKHNNSIYRQVIGIPMGTSCAPHKANIYLHQYEHEHFIKLYEDNKVEELAKLEHIFRYQDDLLCLNDHGLFESILSEIYPPEMIINNTNISVRKSNFLDLTVSIYRGKFYVKLYDKRNDYTFDVINYPFLDGNIPKGQSYGIFISQLVRLARINSTFNNFILDCKNLIRKLERQSFSIAALRKRFEVFVDKYFNIWGKFGVNLTSEHVF